MNNTNHMIAEVQMWQSRTSDLETSVERLREERDMLLTTVRRARHREDVLIIKLNELHDMVKRLTIEVTRHRADGELYP